LQILDAIRYIKKIPDTTNSAAVTRLLAVISDLEENEIPSLVRLALKYTPATRALTGALLEESGKTNNTEILRKSLNPITTYKLSGISDIISSIQNWNIKQ